MSDQDRDWDRAQASDSQISHQGSQNRHNRDRDVASIGYLEELSYSSLSVSLSQYRQYKLGSLTRDTIPLDNIVTLSHYLPFTS